MIINKDKYFEDIKNSIDSIPNIELLKNKKILITGSTGMLISPVVDIINYLNNNYDYNIKMYLAGRSEKSMQERFSNMELHTDYEFVKFDASSNDSNFGIAEDIDLIIHGASPANPKFYATEPVETILSNVIGLNNLFEFGKDHNVKRVMYISSSEVYGKIDNGNKPYKEDDYGYVDILNSRSCYPNAKRLAETLCSSYTDEYGIETVMVRPGHIYGPTIRRSDTRASAEFTWNVIDDMDIVMKSSGSQLRSYTYVVDCASAVLAVLINGKSKEAYNISNKDSIITIRQFAEKLAFYAGKNIVFENPSDVELKGFNTMSCSALNSEKLEGLGWKAKFDADHGIEHTINIMTDKNKTLKKTNRD